ncbi:MAG: divergent polysaccharide deacetylase family protein, partial [Deltaproteobacteria bacterium]|nr:divergent polysaccharide deacetylase family protein [Deltaproteobacteria bacterium]
TWEVKVKVDNLLAHHLILHPPRIKPPPIRPPRPRLAIVVDDLGTDKRVAEELLRLDAPITFSILPFQPHSRRIAQKAHAQGKEVILHLPLEPRGFPLKDPGKGALFVAMSERELLRQLRKDLDAVPFIVGVNNHMGSRFMEHGVSVRLVLGELKKRGLFFLDSRTTAKTQGYQIARELALLAGERDLFLDNENDVQDIRAQLEGLIRLARDHGRAIGICHPYPSTITALKGMITKIKAAGIRIVPLSQALD